MPKAIAHPTESRLNENSRQHLVKLANEHGLSLRQNYHRQAPRIAAQIGRYAHAKQYRRMKKSLRMLKTRVGWVHREITRQIDRIGPEHQERVSDILHRAHRILTQQTKDKNKLDAFHAPEVECISKGRLGRNPLKGAIGDALHAVLCGAGHNIRLLLRKLRLLFALVIRALTESNWSASGVAAGAVL